MDIFTTMNRFKAAIIKHGEYLEEGNTNKANTEMDKISELGKIIKEEKKLELLENWLNDENKYVQLRSAIYLHELRKYTVITEQVIKKLSDEESGFYSSTAYLILDMWKNNR